MPSGRNGWLGDGVSLGCLSGVSLFDWRDSVPYGEPLAAMARMVGSGIHRCIWRRPPLTSRVRMTSGPQVWRAGLKGRRARFC